MSPSHFKWSRPTSNYARIRGGHYCIRAIPQDWSLTDVFVDVDLMLTDRFQRSLNIKPILGERFTSVLLRKRDVNLSPFI